MLPSAALSGTLTFESDNLVLIKIEGGHLGGQAPFVYPSGMEAGMRQRRGWPLHQSASQDTPQNFQGDVATR